MLLSGPAIIESAPFAKVTIDGFGFGLNGTLTLAQPGADILTFVDIPASFTDTSISFNMPDGLNSGPLVINSLTNSTSATALIRVNSQYVSADEYVASGEGVDTSTFAPGELDSVLRKASSYIDVWVGNSLRLASSLEEYPWIQSRRIYPRKWPIQSVEAFTVVVSNNQQATVNIKDVVINADNRYLEVISYSVATYSYAQAIQNIGLSANIVKLSYTHGFSVLDYPQPLRTATILVATEMLTYRKIQEQGFGGFSNVQQGNQRYERRSETFEMPKVALELLRPYKSFRLV